MLASEVVAATQQEIQPVKENEPAMTAVKQTQVSQEFVTSELDKQGLAEVTYNTTENDDASLDTDYFLRLVNCQTQIAQKCQKVYIEDGVKRRR